MAFLRRTKSFENISNADVPPSASIYRDPRRDALGDDQSLLDRSTMTQTTNYEPSPTEEYQTPPPPLPVRNYEPASREKPHRIAALIEPYRGLFDKRTAIEWFKDYDRMSFANNWTTEYKARQVYFWLADEPKRECADIIDKHPDIQYDDLRVRLERAFPDDVSTLSHFDNLQERKLKKNEPVLVYFCDKMLLINKYKREMPFELIRDWVLSGLTPDFRLDLCRTFGTDTTKLDSIEKLRTALKETEKWRMQTRLLRPEKTVEIEAESVTYPKDVPLRGRLNGNGFNFRKMTRFNNARRNDLREGASSRPDNNQRQEQQDRVRAQNNQWQRPRGWERPNNDRKDGQVNQRERWNDGPRNPNANTNVKEVRSVAIEGNDPRKKKIDTRVIDSNPPQRFKAILQDEQEQRPKYSRAPNGDPICFECGLVGHTRWYCPQRRQSKPKVSEN